MLDERSRTRDADLTESAHRVPPHNAAWVFWWNCRDEWQAIQLSLHTRNRRLGRHRVLTRKRNGISRIAVACTT